MEITPRELRDVEIREAFRGYSRDEVNELLERAAATIDAANERMQQMTERLSAAQSETSSTRETEDILHRTLLLAQRAADEAVGEATAKARQMLDDAEIQSRRVIADAEAEARRRGETERRRLEEEIVDLAGRRDSLLADVEALTRFEADYRDRMVRALEADLSALRSKPPASPGARPEPSEVEIPVLSEGFARREPAEPAPSPAPSPFATQSPQSSEPSSAPSPFGAPASAPPASPSSPSPSSPPPWSTDSGRSSGAEASTLAVDMRSLFEGNPGPSARAPEQSAATAVAGQPGLEQSTRLADPLVGDPVETEALDDDAFFATLREAVHDDTPLGPREDDEVTGQHSFFNQDQPQPGFFRRRR